MANRTGITPSNFKRGQTLTADDLMKIVAGGSPYIQGTRGNLVTQIGDQLRIQAPRRRGRGPPSSTGGTLQIVKAQAAGSGGSVSVKNISILSNPASSPNYEETGDAYNVTYFQD